jgi:RNA polymerase sigma-70 factor (ECF subfamily)
MTTADVTLDVLLAHRSLVRRIAADLLVDPDAADDVVQQTWLAALRHGARGGDVRAPLLSRIARRLALNRKRDARRRLTHERAAPLLEAMPDPARIAETEELRGRVLGAVLALEEPFRSTVLLRYLDESSEAEVAARLRVPVETVRSRLKTARSSLRERLKDDAPGATARGLVGLAGSSRALEFVVAEGITMGAKAWAGVAVAVLIGAVYLGHVFVDGSDRDPVIGKSAQEVGRVIEGTPANVRADAQSPTRSNVAGEASAVPAAALDRIALTGVCEAPDGSPIERAVVRAGSDPRSVSSTTGVDGRFRVEFDPPIEPGTAFIQDVVARAVGRATVTKRVRCDAGEVRELGRVVMPAGGAIRGRVVDAADRPIVATLRLHEGFLSQDQWAVGLDDDVARVATDVDGRFAFEGLTEGWYALVAEARDHGVDAATPVGVSAGLDADVRIEVRPLRDEESIVGRVVDESDHPLADVPRALDAVGPIECRRIPHGDARRSQRCGRSVPLSCRCRRRDELLGDVRGWANRDRTTRAWRCARCRPAQAHDADVRPHDPRRGHANPIRRRHGDRNVGRRFSCRARTERGRARAFSVRSGDDGIARVPTPPREFTLRIEGHDRTPVQLGPYRGDHDPALDAILLRVVPSLRVVVEGAEASAGPIHLTVAREMGGASGWEWGGLATRAAEVVSARTIEPNAEVQVGIGDLAQSEHWFLRATCRGSAPARHDLVAADLSPERIVRLRLTRGGVVTGLVRVRGIESATGLAVLASDGVGERKATRVTQDGTYRFAGLVPGRWEFAVALEDDVPVRHADRLVAPAADVVVAEGTTSTLDLTYDAPARVVVEGVVRIGDASTYGIAIALVEADDRTAASLDARMIRSSLRGATITPSGAYRIEPASVGPCVLKVSLPTSSGSTSILRPCTIGVGHNVVDVIERCGSIVGSRTGTRMRMVQARAERADGTVVLVNARCDPSTGEFTMPLVPAGSYTLFADDRADPIVVTAGERVVAPDP